MIEIKSTDKVRADHIKSLNKIADQLGNQVETVCLAQVPQALKFDKTMVYPWQEGICRYLVPDDI